MRTEDEAFADDGDENVESENKVNNNEEIFDSTFDSVSNLSINHEFE